MSGFAHPCPNCGCEGCPECTGCDDTPAQLQLVLSGFTDGGCSNCDEGYNGTFILDRHCVECGADNPNVCEWMYITSPNCIQSSNDLNRLCVKIFKSSGDSVIEVFFRIPEITPGTCFHFVSWLRDTTTSPAQNGLIDCTALSNYEVPFFDAFSTGMVDGTICTHDGSSAFLTSL